LCLYIYQSPNNVAHYLKDIREAKFAGTPHSPHCGSEHIKGHGKYRSRQRYKCKACNRTFNDTTASPLAGTRYPQKWAQHIQLMTEQATLQKVAEALGIHQWTEMVTLPVKWLVEAKYQPNRLIMP
jgi:transposase-like protein